MLLWFSALYEGNECSRNVMYTGTLPNQVLEFALDYLLRNRCNTARCDVVVLWQSDAVFSAVAKQKVVQYLAMYDNPVEADLDLSCESFSCRSVHQF